MNECVRLAKVLNEWWYVDLQFYWFFSCDGWNLIDDAIITHKWDGVRRRSFLKIKITQKHSFECVQLMIVWITWDQKWNFLMAFDWVQHQIWANWEVGYLFWAIQPFCLGRSTTEYRRCINLKLLQNTLLPREEMSYWISNHRTTFTLHQSRNVMKCLFYTV